MQLVLSLLVIVAAELWLNIGSVIIEARVSQWSNLFWVAQLFYFSGHLLLSLVFGLPYIREAGITPALGLGIQIAAAFVLLDTVKLELDHGFHISLQAMSLKNAIGAAVVVVGAMIRIGVRH
jgi:hypothetical protein